MDICSQRANTNFIITENVKISAGRDLAAAQQFCKLFDSKFGFSPGIAEDMDEGIVIQRGVCNKEGYRIEVSDQRITVTAADKRGAIYGMQTLLRLCREEDGKVYIEKTEIFEEPYKKFRGVHLLPPSPNQLEEFKRVIDVLCFLKYNTVIMEIGGSMEFERHPEVNAAWKMFCELMHGKFPGGPQNLQWSDRYWKNSTHTIVADGKILSKEEMKDIVDYAKSLGISVIPEIQALSHCYHLTLAHREIAEDQEDIFPDTYCPLNEKSYELYFDIADEVIEVFRPDIVSIGHDEVRIMCECPKCKTKTGHELLAYEINRLYDFYKSRNIRITLWAEKLMSPEQFGEKKLGGALIERRDDYGRYWRMPATYKALHELPRDILMIDWYNLISGISEQEFVDEGFEVIYGNFNGTSFKDWDKRSRRVSGAEYSTWCPSKEFSLGRDGAFIHLIFSSEILWNHGFCDDLYQEYMYKSVRISNEIRWIMRGKASLNVGDAEILYKGEEGDYKIAASDAVTFNPEAERLIKKCGDVYGTPIDMNNISSKTNIYAKELVFVSAFKKREEFYHSYNYTRVPGFDRTPGGDTRYENVDLPRWTAATFAVLYEDNTIELVNMTYGISGTDINVDWGRQSLKNNDGVAEVDDLTKEGKKNKMDAPGFKVTDPWIYSATYFSMPVISSGKTAYIYTWKNPHPEKKIVRIKAINTTRDKEQSLLLFALAYI